MYNHRHGHSNFIVPKGQSMNNMQDTFLFPFQDKESWNRFLIACAVMLAAFIIPILPVILLTGYSMKIMRQIIDERRAPSMPDWQGSDWSEMLLDGLRLYGAQMVLMLPLFLLLGVGVLFMVGGSISFAAVAEEEYRSIAAAGGILFFVGMIILLVFALLSLPYGIITAAAQAHVAAKRSFTAAFEFRQWWQIFRKALGQFMIAYLMIIVASFVLTFIVQLAMMTLVLMCIVPFIMIPYSAYIVLVTNALYAQAYTSGLEDTQVA